MRSAPDLSSAFAVDRHSAVPLFRQIYERTRAAIAAGRLRPGDKLPSARSLAAQLGAARGTVDAACAMLAGEGWIAARGAAGTIVAPLVTPSRTRPWTLARPLAEPLVERPVPALFQMG